MRAEIACSTVIPRLKPGQATSGAGAPVKITLDTIDKYRNTTLCHAASVLGISPTALKKACRKLGVLRWPLAAPDGTPGLARSDAEHDEAGAFQRQPPRGMCIITNEAAVAIFKARDENRQKQDKLATRLSVLHGISTKAVRDIWNLRTWSHVTKPFWTAKDSRRVLLSKLCAACKKKPAIASIEDACEACTASATVADAAAQGSAGAQGCEVLCSVCGCNPPVRSSNPNDLTTRRLKEPAAEIAGSAADELTEWGFRPPAEFGGRWSVGVPPIPVNGASASSGPVEPPTADSQDEIIPPPPPPVAPKALEEDDSLSPWAASAQEESEWDQSSDPTDHGWHVSLSDSDSSTHEWMIDTLIFPDQESLPWAQSNPEPELSAPAA
jgi:hypothetical protein